MMLNDGWMENRRLAQNPPLFGSKTDTADREQTQVGNKLDARVAFSTTARRQPVS